VNEAARQQLDAIYAENGVLEPKGVLQDARREKSPLHAYFEWDDKKAANAYRLTQARELIASYEIVMGDERVRGYLWRPSANSFVKTEDAIKSVTLWREVFTELQREVEVLIARNERLAQHAPSRAKRVFDKETATMRRSAKRIGAASG